MSEFFRALGQAERDRALREQGRGRPSPPSVEPPTPAAPVDEAAEPGAAPTPQVRAGAPALRTGPVEKRPETPSPSSSDASGEELDGHFVSLVTPATFEAEQYRAL